MASLSLDIIIDVLCRLGVKDLLRFRCVSKPFCSSIDDPDFIKLHLSHSLKTNNNRSIIFRCTRPNDNTPLDSRYCYLLSANFDSLKTAQTLYHPLDESDEGKYTQIVGSCNGLLALFDGGKDISLWNPSTRKSQMVPFTGIEILPSAARDLSLVFGLGYDPTSDDYKLVRVIQFDSLDSEVKVYSLKTNSWRRIKDFPFYLKYQIVSGILANNALHWVVSRTPRTDALSFGLDFGFVVALDLETEDYGVVELPDRIGDYIHIYVKAMEGCLCLIATYWTSFFTGTVSDIWMMKEYGVKESWTKLVSLNPFEPIPDFKSGLPLAFSKNGDEVMLYINENKLMWYDMTTKRVEQIKIEGVPSRFCVQMLVESLVPLNGNGAVINKGKKQHSEKKQKEQRKKNTKRDDFLSKGFHLVL